MSVTHERRAVAAPHADTVGRDVVLGLALVEGRRLVLHPVFLGGVALALALIFTSEGWPNPPYHVVTGMAAFPVALVSYLVVWLAARRPERDATAELYRTAPVHASSTTVAHLISLVAAAVVAIALTGVAVLWLAVHQELLVTESVTMNRVPSVAELAQGPASVLVFGALGLAAARWLPVAVGPVMLLVVFFASTGIGGTKTNCDYAAPTARWFSPFVDFRVQEHPRCAVEGFATTQAAWHGVYLVGLALAAGGVALLRHGTDRRAVVLAGAGAVTAVAGGLLQLL